MYNLLVEEIKCQRKKTDIVYELYEDEVSLLKKLYDELKVKIGRDLEEVFDEILPVNIYGDEANQIWFEFDILGLELDEKQVKMIEKITNTIMNEQEMFFFKKNE